MLRYRGGELVKAGTYLSLRTGEFVAIHREGGKLPGETRVQYLRAPLPGVMAVGPLMGLVFILFVPFAAVAAVIAFGSARLGRMIKATSQSLVQVAAPAWKPGVSFFTRQRRPATKGPAAEEPGKLSPEKKEDLLSTLEEEIRAKRRKEE